MGRVKYEKPEDVRDALLLRETTTKSVYSKISYYRRKGDQDMVDLLQEGLSLFWKDKKEIDKIVEMINEQRDGDDWVGHRD